MTIHRPIHRTVLLGALVAALVLGTAASAALAAAMDPDVRARQEAMGLIGSNVKKVTQMVKGEVAFDAAGAQAAFAAIAEKADMVPALFENPSNSDPEAEAKDAIWENWDDFYSRSLEAADVAYRAGRAASHDEVLALTEELEGMCISCHDAYRRPQVTLDPEMLGLGPTD